MRVLSYAFYLIFGCCLLGSACLFADADKLMRALLCVEELDRQDDIIPTTYNNFLQGGYWNMPSARMGMLGEIGAGVSSVPPYRSANLRLQILSHLEVTGNYRLFCGVPDPILSKHGFGDLSERGINIKWSLLNPEDTQYALPGIAIGLDDFTGTKSFRSEYIVATQVLPKYGLEISLGFGQKRLKGFFGGILWMPYTLIRHALTENAQKWLRPLCIGAEYDATNYRDPKCERHPKGRKISSRINFGCKYRLLDTIDLSLSYVRGEKIAFACDVVWNIGNCGEWVPKTQEPLPFTGPSCPDPCLQDYEIIEEAPGQGRLSAMKELEAIFKAQGFSLLRAHIEHCTVDERQMRLTVTNDRYYWEQDVQLRLQALVSGLEFSNIDAFIVEIEENGCSIQEYRWSQESIDRYVRGEICSSVLSCTSPLKEVSCPCGPVEFLFCAKRPRFEPFLDPKTLSLFGSANGKWKYALGISTGAQGYLIGDIFYSLSLGYFALSTIPTHSFCDCLNPSQLPNVQTNEILFVTKGKLTLDEAYVQKNFLWPKPGHFFRAAAGYFDVMYGGVVAEWLYFPVNSAWAVGLEGSYLRQRIPGQVRFTNRIRQCKNGEERFIKFPLYQLFLDVYYHWFSANVDAQVTFGRFLAGDVGARFALSHNYPSGFRVTVWYTPTNAHDRINGSTYFDTGIGFSMPLDLFYTYRSRKEWGSGLSPWLRDCGVRRFLGSPLYPTIRAARR